MRQFPQLTGSESLAHQRAFPAYSLFKRIFINHLDLRSPPDLYGKFTASQRPAICTTGGIILAFFWMLVCATGARIGAPFKKLEDAHGTRTLTTMVGYWQ